MPELIAPTIGLEAAWREAHEEWGQGAHEDGFLAAAVRRCRFACRVRNLADAVG
jgi:hypothetical protein